MGCIVDTILFKKGDTLDKLARKYGLKDGKELLNAAENARLKKLRGTPDKVQPGDKLVIPPPNEKGVKTNFSKDTDRMTFDICGAKRLVSVEQRWQYTYDNDDGTSPWTTQEQRDFRHHIDLAIMTYWSGHFTLSVAGGSDFARLYRNDVFKVGFDIRFVTSGGHWKVNVTKVAPRTKMGSKINWGNRTIQLDSNDTKMQERVREGKHYKQVPAAHEFGHTIGNTKHSPNSTHGDEYKSGSPFKAERKSMMNDGMELRKRHADHLIAELNKMIPDTVFAVKTIR